MDIVLDRGALSLDSVAKFVRDPTTTVRVAPAAMAALRSTRAGVDALIASNTIAPGVTTGFGPLADKRLSADQLVAYRQSVVPSRMTGVGSLLPPPETRLLMLLRANSLAKGFSGVRPEILEALVALVNSRLFPAIPVKGSTGAGDRAPLAHLAAALSGDGLIVAGGRPVPAGTALAEAGLRPVTFQAHEALAFTNGTEFMTAIGARVVVDALMLARAADIVAALTMEALCAPEAPLEARVESIRPHPGQQASARNIRRLIARSPIRESRQGQRPRRAALAHSVRCTSQVHGAARDAIAYVERVIAIELSSATDETYVIPARAGPGFEAVSSGNFHGAPVAIAFDVLGLALAHLGAVAERRTAKLVSSPDSGFPLYLTPREAGLHAGLMEAQVTATALAAENRALARPASLDSIPTSEVEDLLSLGPAAARKARQILENVELIAAIELMAAVQALEFHVPLCSTPALEAVRGAVRDFVAPLDVDRALSQDMSRTTALLRDGMILRRVEEALGGALD